MSEPDANKVLLIMWEYDISHGRETEFAKMYGPEGDWAQLFQQAPGYIKSELLIDKYDKDRAIILDWWESREAYEKFLREYKAEYEAMNARAEMFNASETCLGWFSRDLNLAQESKKS